MICDSQRAASGMHAQQKQSSYWCHVVLLAASSFRASSSVTAWKCNVVGKQTAVAEEFRDLLTACNLNGFRQATCNIFIFNPFIAHVTSLGLTGGQQMSTTHSTTILLGSHVLNCMCNIAGEQAAVVGAVSGDSSILRSARVRSAAGVCQEQL